MISLCISCQHVRLIQTPKGSRFLLCNRSLADSAFHKYPPQPVRLCAGFIDRPPEPKAEESPDSD